MYDYKDDFKTIRNKVNPIKDPTRIRVVSTNGIHAKAVRDFVAAKEVLTLQLSDYVSDLLEYDLND